MKKIMKKYYEIKKDENDIFNNDDYDDIWSGFQGRIGGYKGVWYINPTLKDDIIKVRPSMKKIEYNSSESDEYQNTIEVLSYSYEGSIGKLNSQFILCLIGNSVPDFVFMKLYEDNIKIYNGLNEKENIKRYLSYHRLNDDENLLYELCKTKYLYKDVYTETLINKLQKKVLSNIKSFHLIDTESRRLMVIPDPFGLLNEKEVFINTSIGYNDNNNSNSNTKVWKGDAIVCRNPCYKSSDVQKVKCIDIEIYRRYYKNIVLVSTKGKYSILDLLSGGDYDGDHIWISQNPLFLSYFKEYKSRNIVCVNEYIKNGNAKNINDVYNEWSNKIYELGRLSNLHEAFSDKYGVNYYKCELLSELISICLDNKKNGKIVEIPKNINKGAVLFPHYRSEMNVRHSDSVLGKIYDKSCNLSNIINTERIENYNDYLIKENYIEIKELSEKMKMNDLNEYEDDIKEYNKVIHNHIINPNDRIYIYIYLYYLSFLLFIYCIS